MGRKNLIWLGGLALANLLVLASIAQVWFGSREAQKGARDRDQLALPQPKTLRSKEALDSFNVVVAKDLFSPDRSGGEMSPAKGQTLEDGLLLGTIIVGDEKAVLIGQTGAKGKQKIQVLRQGDHQRRGNLPGKGGEAKFDLPSAQIGAVRQSWGIPWEEQGGEP
jgi:hypothetical protein